MWLLSKGENPSQVSRHRNTLTILTLGADELFLGHGLQAETLQVEHAAALALAGQQWLARALADLQQAQSSAGNRVPWNARDCQVLTGTACNCFRIRGRQESWTWPVSGPRTIPARPVPGSGVTVWPRTEKGEALRIHLPSSISQGTSCSCSSGSLLLTRELDRTFQDFFFSKYWKILCSILTNHLESSNGVKKTASTFSTDAGRYGLDTPFQLLSFLACRRA